MLLGSRLRFIESYLAFFLGWVVMFFAALFMVSAHAAISCSRTVTANIVAIDQPILFNRLGASNVNGMIYALERDVINKTSGLTLNNGGLAVAGDVELRPDKRPRPLVLRVRAGDCLDIKLTNLLNVAPNPIKPVVPGGDPLPGNDQFNLAIDEQVLERNVSLHVAGLEWRTGAADDGSHVGTNADSTVPRNNFKTYRLYAPKEGAYMLRGMASTLGSDANQGNAANGLFGQVIVEPVGARIYRSEVTEEEMRLASMDLVPDSATCGMVNTTATGHPIVNYEARYPVTDCDPINLVGACADGTANFAGACTVDGDCGEAVGSCENIAGSCAAGSSSPGAICTTDGECGGAVGSCENIAGACAAGTANVGLSCIADGECGEAVGSCENITNIGGTGVELGALVWDAEGKADLPILNMIDPATNEIVHSVIEGVIAGSNTDGSFPPSTYPLENIGKRNPSLPNRLEPFRDFASVFHDEPGTAQAFPGFYKTDPVFKYVLAGVKDGFMINYGSGGIGSEILANRLQVGPMHDCMTCAYEEFFLTSYTVGDPAQLVDVAANTGIEGVLPADIAAIKAGTSPLINFLGPKATMVPYPDDVSNVHHSYTGDFVKFRNTHVGAEQHVFHLHNHQWLYNPNDDNSNYLDAQGIGPGSGYTYEINFGGSGNRPKSAGDAIFHCHFYPHFAQGMWYLWRNHDVFESGTLLEASGIPEAFHTAPWALQNGTPMLAQDAGITAPTGARVRSLPDGEVVAGAPIPAIVPLPGKAMAPLPGKVVVVPNSLTTTASAASPTTVDLDPGTAGNQVPVGSLARVLERPTVTEVAGVTTISGKNPGYPFWIAGIEDIVGQRPPTPPLDMADSALVDGLGGTVHVEVLDADGSLVDTVSDLFGNLVADQAGGVDGGLPRAALQGYAAGGHAVTTESAVDFSKVVEEAQAVFYPEEGTDVEKLAMGFHAIRNHPSTAVNMLGIGIPKDFVLNGNLPAIGAPYHEPCMDDNGVRLGTGITGNFFSGEDLTNPKNFTGSSPFNADTPRIYKGAQIQFDAVLNKVGYHYPQQRILTLWEDAVPVITKQAPPEPFVLRFNTFDCGVYHHANLTPEYYEMDDYQVRTPTDIIGQHIHLPKWDLTTADGAANGWNYEDGTLSPGAVRERISALNCFANGGAGCPGVGGGMHLAGTGSGALTPPTTLTAQVHPFFGSAVPDVQGGNWLGARTTQQRWFFDPVVNTQGEDRGLGIIFTHDHYGPSTHQQIGLYATVLTEPAGSTWVHNETGQQLGCTSPGDAGCRADGGPTSWQAVVKPPSVSALEPYREFYFEYSDFQHAYEAGVYVGAGQDGVPLGKPVPGVPSPMFTLDEGNPVWDGTPANAFRFAINPPARAQVNPVFPDLVLEVAGGGAQIPGCPVRPCPQAIDVQDPGMFAVNYRNEPLALRVFDPNRQDCPDDLTPNNGVAETGGCQTLGDAGDLAFALQTRIDRAIPELNVQPQAGDSIFGTVFPPPINAGGVEPGDPFTPMMRTYTGDLIRVKMQAGGDEEEHNASIHGLKWLQAGSGYGKAPNSGWRNSQAGGISEQFTLRTTPVPTQGARGGVTDYAWTMDASIDGWWSGMWGLLRSYNTANAQGPLQLLPTTVTPTRLANDADYEGPCRLIGSKNNKRVEKLRSYDITAVLANDVLPVNANVAIADICAGGANADCAGAGFEGVAPDPAGGTLIYNPRTDKVGGQTVIDPETGATVTLPAFNGPIHDPTAMLYVRTGDLEPQVVGDPACFEGTSFKPELPGCDVRLRDGVRVEPLVLRAAAGECIDVTLRNALLDGAVVAAGEPNAGDLVCIDNGGTPVPVFLPPDPGVALFNCNDPGFADPADLLVPVALLPGAVTFDRLPDLPTYSSLIGAVKRDRFFVNGLEQGATTFQTNLIQASSHVGLHPQLVAYDISRDDGNRVGNNAASTVAPGARSTLRWYAGDLAAAVQGSSFRLSSTAVEFGGVNLQPADKIKQGMKSLVGQLVIEPAGASWEEDADDVTGRQTATVTTAADGDFRDFSLVWTKGLTHHYADSSPVAHINGEGVGIPEDPQDSTGMALNYGIEPLWFRLGILPQSPFGNAGSGAGTFGGILQSDVFSNAKGGGADPVTPVFEAKAGDPVRMRVTVPHGTNRGSTFALHGHTWQRDPYLAENVVAGGFPDGDGGLGSVRIGDNPLAFYQSGQESIWASTHFDIVLPHAGGTANADGSGGVTGDYLYRDVGALGNASGLWGILRVTANDPLPPDPPTGGFCPAGSANPDGTKLVGESCETGAECCSGSCGGNRRRGRTCR